MVNTRDRDKKLSDLRADRDDLRQQQIDLQNELEKANQDRINHSLNRAADQVRHPIRYSLRPELLSPTDRAGLMPVKNPEIEKRLRDAEARAIENERERIANFDKFLKQKERDPWVR